MTNRNDAGGIAPRSLQHHARAPEPAAPNAFVIDTDETIAGIVVTVGRGYRFFSSGRPFDALEGRIFRDPAAAQSAARRLETERRRRALRVV